MTGGPIDVRPTVAPDSDQTLVRQITDVRAGNEARLAELGRLGAPVDLSPFILAERINRTARALLGPDAADEITLEVEDWTAGILDQVLKQAKAAQARATLLQPAPVPPPPGLLRP